MAKNMYIGYKKPNGSVSAICARVDWGEDQNKLFYKYYRTPERVSALIKSGSTRSPLGIYISETEEFNERSPLYNEEVMMLPLYVGSAGVDGMISFAEDKFCKNKDGNSGEFYDYGSVEAFYDDTKKIGIFEDCVYLFDSESCEWTVGYNGKKLKDVIIENFDKYSEYYDSHDGETLIANIAEIDQFIADRAKTGPHLIDGNTGDIFNIRDDELLKKCYDLYMCARSKGFNIEGIIFSNSNEMLQDPDNEEKVKKGDSLIKVFSSD